MRNTSPPPHKQDNGMDRKHKAMSPRMYRDNDHDHDKAGETRTPAEGANGQPTNPNSPPADASEPVAAGRSGAHHYSADQDRRGYERSYQREHNNIGRYERSAHDLQKDGRQSRND